MEFFSLSSCHHAIFIHVTKYTKRLKKKTIMMRATSRWKEHRISNEDDEREKVHDSCMHEKLGFCHSHYTRFNIFLYKRGSHNLFYTTLKCMTIGYSSDIFFTCNGGGRHLLTDKCLPSLSLP